MTAEAVTVVDVVSDASVSVVEGAAAVLDAKLEFAVVTG